MVVMVLQVHVMVLQEQLVQLILVQVVEEVIITLVMHPHLFLIHQHKIEIYLVEMVVLGVVKVDVGLAEIHGEGQRVAEEAAAVLRSRELPLATIGRWPNQQCPRRRTALAHLPATSAACACLRTHAVVPEAAAPVEGDGG